MLNTNIRNYLVDNRYYLQFISLRTKKYQSYNEVKQFGEIMLYNFQIGTL